MKEKKILVSGSLAYDRIMDFPGRFKDHILPDQIHILNVCFSIDSLSESYGGTAGNIAYNLSLLKEEPVVLGVVGDDFTDYKENLIKNKINITLVKEFKDSKTASAYIITDKDDNQITGFYPGPQNIKYAEIVNKQKKVDIAMIAPENHQRMLCYAEIYKRNNIKYIFDPGQQTAGLTGAQIKKAINGAEVLIGNDYEIKLILNKLKITLDKLSKSVKILIITKGSEGSEIYLEGKKIKIKPMKAKTIKDPTGAGDAYRAGLIKGIVSGLDLESVGRLASTVAVYAVEKYGTQKHKFSLKQVRERYQKNYGEDVGI